MNTWKWFITVVFTLLMIPLWAHGQLQCGNPCADFGNVYVSPATKTVAYYNNSVNIWINPSGSGGSGSGFYLTYPSGMNYYTMYQFNVVFTGTTPGTYSATMSVTYRSTYPSSGATLTITISARATYAPGQGTVYPKYQVVSVIYAPPGKSSSVDYGSSTIVGTGTSWSNSFSTGTTLATTFSSKKPILGGLSGTVSQSWTQTGENNGSISVEKTTNNNISVPGPGNSNSGVDHNADIILLWINPQGNFQVTSPTSAKWEYVFDQRDPANEVHIVPVYVAWLKNPSSMPIGIKDALARTWAGPGQGLNDDDYATILARDPFANGNSTIDSKRFDLQAGQTFSYVPPPCGYQPITQSFSTAYSTTTAYGQTATDEYSVSYTKTGQVGFLDWFSVNYTAGSSLSWKNHWAQQNQNTQGQSAHFSITGPEDCNYSGKTQVQAYQDNVYGTFMFALF